MVQLYKNTMPELNDTVIAIVNEINSLNVITFLPDYNNLTAYISYSELSKKKRININKIVSFGKEVVALVSGVNKEKNYVELSIRILVEKDIEAFHQEHKRYLALYNLWRYIYLKLHPELNMNIEKINDQSLNTFMENTLWEIQDNIENCDDETVLNDLLNIEKNMDIITLIKNQDENIDKIKSILDNYISLKTTVTKPTTDKEIKLISYEMEGSHNIKYSLDYKSYEFYSDLKIDYDMEITYLSDSLYRIHIKQKDVILHNINNNINSIYDKIINEIKKRCNVYDIVLKV
jgi:translation initiation factor 2 alpha subunit (eIF-2alpha)